MENTVVIPAGPSIEEITAQMRSVAADAMRDLVTHKQCHDMILAALDKPRGQYAAASDVTGLLEWKKTACGALEHLEVEKANKGDLTGSLSGLKTDLVMQLGHVNDDVKQMVVAMKHNETEALMRLHAKMDSLTSYVDKIDLEIAAHLRPVVNDSMRRKGHVGGVSDDRNTDLESKMARFEKKSQQIHSLQMDQIARLVDSLQSVESELRHRPKEGQIQAMVHMIEEEFKKLLGSNVGDIQQTIQRIVNAIHSKAGKGEVVKLISSSIAHVQLDISKINQGEVPAGGYKCLSCGHNGATVRLMTGSPHPHEDPVMSRSAPDDASVGSAMSLLSDPSTAAVINRTAGLRPLGGFHEPQDPKVAAIAEKKRNAQAHMHRSRPTTSQEPLYRRARLAAQLKEIPKVTPVDLGHLPQYAMDDEDISVGSLASFESLSFHSPKKGDLHSRSVSSEILKLPQVHSSPAFSKSSVLGETERT